MMGADGRNGTKTQGSTCGISEEGEGAEDDTAGGQLLAEGGGGKSYSCGGDKTSQDLN